MTIGQVLHHNILRNAANSAVQSLTYSGTETVGFEKENIADWRDFSQFRVDDNGGVATTLDWTAPEAEEIDTFCWYAVDPGVAGTFTITLQAYNDTLVGYETLAVANVTSSNLMGMAEFTAIALGSGDYSTQNMRLSIVCVSGTDLDIRAIAVGSRLEFPIGQHQGIKPPGVRGQFVATNNISVNGSFIGRDIVKQEVQGELMLEYVTPAFARGAWDDFVTHAQRYAFFYAWNYDDYPTEIVFAWALSTPSAENTGPGSRMKVSMPWGGKVD